MKKYLTILLTVVTFALVSLVSCADTESVCVDKGASFFSDYSVDGNEVKIKCHVTLKNLSDSTQTVNLSAKLPEDVAGGLLVSEDVYALNDDGSLTKYVVPPNSSIVVEVVFTGNFAGTNIKNDKRLPRITVTIVDG